ncbi:MULTISPECIES: group III truncated hemoglobin [Galbibacter]|uniref:Group III truncated hemoglobin n=1 Tax=Galbibacter pacificus TaxID=2996052 RepID=A0ABT6FRP6_9FLAO|nr:group III truncated hemoglobin [Galbibacter pacificus]MDG3582936.1 group III truncated hemoglobin [Galbibacter pacificus]MDG3585945.1 group III truncated hemoglobin [Galbibacter pacificus]
MATKKRIETLADIKHLIDSFYDKVRRDNLLGPVFNEKIGNQWASHLEKMYRFWQTVLLEEHTYNGTPFMAHGSLPIHQIHFDTWLDLFENTVDSLFTGEKAREAKWRARKMAEMFQLKLQYHRSDQTKPL